MHGTYNMDCNYVVHSMKTGETYTFTTNDDPDHSGYSDFVIVKATVEEDLFYKFGGHRGGKLSDSFYVGHLENGDSSRPIIWRQKESFRLEIPLHSCGVILHNHFLITFGGQGHGPSQNAYLDDIYILNTQSNNGWVQSPTKCPMKGPYVAAMDHQNHIHLFSRCRRHRIHCNIAFDDLIE